MPVIGDQNAYTTNAAIVHKIVGCQFTCPAGGPFEVSKLTAYIYNGSAGGVKAAIYTADGNLVSNSQTPEVTVGATTAWFDFVYSGTKPVLSGGVDYILVIWGSGATTAQFRRNATGAASQWKSYTSVYGANFPASIAAWTLTGNYTGSIYGTLLDPNPQLADDANNLGDAQEFLFGHLSPAEDTLELSDAIETNLISGEPLYVADSMNTMADAAVINYIIWQVALSIAIGDNFITTSGKPPRYDWKDTLGLNIAPFGDLDIYVDDLRSMSADEVAVDYGLLLGDDANSLNDSVAEGHGSETAAYDTLFYNFLDSIIVNLHVPLSVSQADSLNNWDDALINALIRGYGFSDLMSQYDALVLAMLHLLAVSDTLLMSDGINDSSRVIPVAADTLSFSDDVAISTSSGLNTTVGDTLSMTDAVGVPLLNTTFTSYLRRYLNDIID